MAMLGHVALQRVRHGARARGGVVARALWAVLLVMVAGAAPAFGLQDERAGTSNTAGTGSSPAEPARVLFVGNSQLYVGNAPAVFSALAKANGQVVEADMIVQGGATLAQRVEDGSVARALDARPYTALVLQERGGDLLCLFGPDSCVQSRDAIARLAEMGRAHGLQVVLLGTYQSLPQASRKLVEEEAAAAAAAGIPYLEVSERLRRLRADAPGLAWLADDGMHPGSDLALLDAVLVYRQLFGAAPGFAGLTVDAPIYTARSGLVADLRAADAPPPNDDTPRQVSYAAGTVETVARGSILGP